MFARIVPVLMAWILAEGMAHAQEYTLVTYPVADLVVPVSHDHDRDKANTSETKLMAHIAKHVAPATWEQAGGQGTMRYHASGYLLLVQQTAQVHTQLKTFLASLLRGQVALETRIVLATDSDLETMQSWRPATTPGGARPIPFRLPKMLWNKNNGIEYSRLNSGMVKQLVQKVQESQDNCRIQFRELDKDDKPFSNALQPFQPFQQLPKVTALEGQDVTINTGAHVHFLPTIASDGRHVHLQMAINQQAEPAFTVAVAATIPDGETLAILARKAHVELRTEIGSPLGDIPYVGRMFKTVGYGRETLQVMVLITPRIIVEQTVDVQPLPGRFQVQDNGKFPLILPPVGN